MWLGALAAALTLAVVALAVVVVGWVVPFALATGLVTAAAAGLAAWFVTRSDAQLTPLWGSRRPEDERLELAIKRLAEPDIKMRLVAVRDLEPIASASDRDRELVREVLLEHLRQDAREPAEGAQPAGLDVQAALDTLVRLRSEAGNQSPLNLSGLRLREVALVSRDLREANLSGTDLTGADLNDANLRGAMLRGATLSRARLTRAMLDSADLGEADLREADLRDSSLRGALLAGTRLTHANLHGADLREAEYDRRSLEDASGTPRLDGA